METPVGDNLGDKTYQANFRLVLEADKKRDWNQQIYVSIELLYRVSPTRNRV